MTRKRQTRVQCTIRGCRRRYIAAVLCIGPFSTKPMFPTHPEHCLCDYHLDQWTREVLAPRLPTRVIHLAQATRNLR